MVGLALITIAIRPDLYIEQYLGHTWSEHSIAIYKYIHKHTIPTTWDIMQIMIQIILF